MQSRGLLLTNDVSKPIHFMLPQYPQESFRAMFCCKNIDNTRGPMSTEQSHVVQPQLDTCTNTPGLSVHPYLCAWLLSAISVA